MIEIDIQKNTTDEDPLWGEDVTDEAEARAALKAAGFGDDVTLEPAEGGWLVDLTWEEFGDRTTYGHPDAVAIEAPGRFALWLPTH